MGLARAGLSWSRRSQDGRSQHHRLGSPPRRRPPRALGLAADLLRDLDDAADQRTDLSGFGALTEKPVPLAVVGAHLVWGAALVELAWRPSPRKPSAPLGAAA